jgi:hypothetical protein
MIELHNNIELKSAIGNNKKFDPIDSKCSKNYLYAAVYCNNFEAFKMLVNHPKFDMKSNKNLNWLQIILNKYMYNSIENCRFLDELIKINIQFQPVILRECNDVYIVDKIIHNIDKSKPHDLITTIFNSYTHQSTDIQNYILEFVFNNHPGILFKDFVDSNILHNCILKGKIGIIETLCNNNIDIKRCLGTPIILLFLENINFNKEELNYYASKEYFYEENLLDKNLYSKSITINNPFKKMVFLIEHFELFKKCFKYVKDDLYEFTNLIINSIINGRYTSTNYLEEANIIMHFLINFHKDKNDNFFEKIFNINAFENPFEPFPQKPGYHYNSIISVDKELCKVICGCILFHKHQPNDRFSKVIEKAFKPEELINLDKYKPFVIEVKKSKSKKINL